MNLDDTVMTGKYYERRKRKVEMGAGAPANGD